MNKMYLTIGAVAIAALVGFGVMTKEQGDSAETMMSNLSSTMESGLAGATNAIENTMDDAVAATENLAQDAADMIEPAAGEVEAEAETMMDKMNGMMNN